MKSIFFLAVLILLSLQGICQIDSLVRKFESDKVVVTNPNNSNDKGEIEGYSLIVIDFNKSKIVITPINYTYDIVGANENIKKDENEMVTYLCTDNKNKDCKVILFSLKGKITIIKVSYPDIGYMYFISKERE